MMSRTWSATKSQTSANFVCRVLCRKRSIAASAPKGPAAASRSRVLSGILRLFCPDLVHEKGDERKEVNARVHEDDEIKERQVHDITWHLLFLNPEVPPAEHLRGMGIRRGELAFHYNPGIDLPGK